MNFNNSGVGSLCVPGFGLSYDYVRDSDQRFSHGIGDATWPRMTLKEVAMLGLMDSITDRHEWKLKVKDDSIVAKWREEALQIQFMSNEAFDWCIRELREKADENTQLMITLETATRCIKADKLIPQELQRRLQKGIQPLLDGPKDFHPLSQEKVLDLVHPSLYPAVYGRTRVLSEGAVNLYHFSAIHDHTAVIPPVPPDTANQPESFFHRRDVHKFSKKFQWLPCDVEFTEETGTKVKIASYINNLRPDLFGYLYAAIEDVISYSIPAWNSVLLLGQIGRTSLRIPTNGPNFDPPNEPEWIDGLTRDKDDPNWEKDLEKVKYYLQIPDTPLPPGLHRYDILDEDWQNDPHSTLRDVASDKYKRIRKTLHPDPDPQYFERWNHDRQEQASSADDLFSKTYPIAVEDEFRTHGLQVIIKLASVELSPDKPEYDGSNWHLEGALNEHIVATAIYYFDTENITESRIRFRQEAYLDEHELYYEQGEHNHLCEIFGTLSMTDERAIQEIGSLATPEGRLLVFPNTHQHKVEPFRLVDASKPGHRRMLVLWLVDPHYRVLSTRNVLPQQYDWWATDAVVAALQNKVPKEIQEMVLDHMRDGTMTLEEARQYRLDLMDERVDIKQGLDRAVATYNLCEH